MKQPQKEVIMRILFIDIDTLRPDHMSCYGYPRKTTPNLDRIAAEGIRFNSYYTSDAPCLPSRASLVSGMFGIRNGAVGHGGTAADRRLQGPERDFIASYDRENLHNIFRSAGMHTASISTFAERHSSWWFHAGFNEIYDVGKRGDESGEEVLPVALDWIERNGSADNWFLHLHLWDPHTPYRTPLDFPNPFKEEPLNSWITEEIFQKHLQHVGPHSINELGMYSDYESPKHPKQLGKATNMGELKKVFDEYDCGIYYADYIIGQVFGALEAKGVYDNMAVILTSDHGETMGEFGIYSEHGTADQATCRIPFLIKWPGAQKGHVDSGLHYSLDLLPTMADLLGTPKYSNWDGESFSSVVTEGSNVCRDSLVISQMSHVCQRSARFGDWLYIRTYHDGYHLFDYEMLFNLKEDPYEQFDLKEEFPELCDKGASIILDWHDRAMLKSGAEIDPLWTVMKENGPYHTWNALDNYIERLNITGREEGAKKLTDRYKIKKGMWW